MRIVVLPSSSAFNKQCVICLTLEIPNSCQVPADLSNHARGDYFKQYSDFFNLHNKFQCDLFSSPRYDHVTSSFRSPFKKTFLTSSWYKSQSRFTAKESSTWIVFSLATSLQVVNSVRLGEPFLYKSCLEPVSASINLVLAVEKSTYIKPDFCLVSTLSRPMYCFLGPNLFFYNFLPLRPHSSLLNIFRHFDTIQIRGKCLVGWWHYPYAT